MSFDNLSKSQITVLVAVTIFVVIEIFLFTMGYLSFDKNALNGNQDSNNTDNEISTSTENEIPDMTEEIDEDAPSTQPDEVIDVEDSQRDEQLGVYTVTATADGYSPSQLVIEEGTIVSIKFRSQGGTYDFYIPATGNHLEAADGEEEESSFRMNQTGTYRFECRDFCPASGEIVGTLQVNPRQ